MASRPTRSSARQTPSKHQESHSSRAKWTAPLTKVFVDLLLDQVCRGNKRYRSFNKKIWECVCQDFCKKTGVAWDDEQLKGKYGTLRKQYLVVKSLLDQPDFEWNEATCAIAASDEAWDTYIKEHPDSEMLMTSRFPLYNQLCTLFSLPSARAPCNQSNGSVDPPSANPCTQKEETSSSGWDQPADTAEEHENRESNELPKVVGRKRGRKGAEGAVAEAILEMAAASKLRAEAVKKMSGMFSISDCVKALDELEGLDDEMYFSALDLFNNRLSREVFLSLQSEKRLTWLSLKCLGPARTQVDDACFGF